MRTLVVLGLAFACSAATAQLRVTHLESLPLDAHVAWHAPRFAPDGKSIFLTSATYDGIWSYSPAHRTIRQITDERGAGYGFAISPDGRRLAFRRKGNGAEASAIVQVDIASLQKTVVAEQKDLSLPAFAGQGLVSVTGDRTLVIEGTPDAGTTVLGIENTKILITRGGTKTLLDPLGKGSYIWPALSPDGSSLVAVDMARGGFIAETNGRATVMLGRCNAPSWTRDGRWIVCMDDRDDGQKVISSDLVAVSRDGHTRITLTSSPDRLEMYPQCSPTENRIACCTLDGQILLLDYQEDGR